MISIDELTDILNQELTPKFIETLILLWEDGDLPIYAEHPDMEEVLEDIVERINDLEPPGLR